jgi:TolB-like protein
MITAKRPNSPEKGFHIEDNNRSERDSSVSILIEPFMSIANNKKNKKITDAVTNSINRVPKAS